MNAKGLILLLITFTVLTGVVMVWENRQIDLSVAPINVVYHSHAESLGSAIYLAGSNPVANSVPQTNPISTNVTNPFDTYKNPFDTK